MNDRTGKPFIGLAKRIKGVARRWLGNVERKTATWLTDPVALALGRPARATSDLLIVRVDAIGDFILWLDAAKEFRRCYPDRRIVLAANSICVGIAERLPYWDEVWPVDLKRFERLAPYRFELLARIRRHGFASAIQPTYSRIFATGDSLVRASGARERIGSVGDLSNMSRLDRYLANSIYTDLLPSTPGHLTEIERNAEFVSLLRRSPFPPNCPSLPVLGELSEELSFHEKYLVAFPGASAGLRQWPTASFADVVNQLQNEYRLKIVLCGSASERSLCDELAGLIHGPCINLAGATSLWQFAELVRRAELLIGNETSAVHIAAAVSTRAVCILGGGHFGRFMPYGASVRTPAAVIPVFHGMKCFGCNWRCSQPHREGSPVPCITGISVKNVLLASRGALAA